MLLKKEMLFKMIKEGEINACTIIGKPTKEVQEIYFSSNDLMDLFKKYDIENPIQKFEHTPIALYFPQANRKRSYEICSISIRKDCLNIETIQKLIDSFLVETFDLYQFNITPYHLDKIVSNEKLTFEDILLFIGDRQSLIAEKIGKSKQLISDMKSGKAKMGIETLALLEKEYPLLPWSEFIRSFS